MQYILMYMLIVGLLLLCTAMVFFFHLASIISLFYGVINIPIERNVGQCIYAVLP